MNLPEDSAAAAAKVAGTYSSRCTHWDQDGTTQRLTLRQRRRAAKTVAGNSRRRDTYSSSFAVVESRAELAAMEAKAEADSEAMEEPVVVDCSPKGGALVGFPVRAYRFADLLPCCN